MVSQVLHPWPMRPKPHDDELFSSWITRAAHANGQKVTALFSMAAPARRNINKNIDNNAKAKDKHRFSTYLKTPLQQTLATFLDIYEGFLFEKIHQKSKRKQGILFTGDIAYEPDRFYQQFCPHCLSEIEPYFRKKWRIAYITTCSKHKTVLLDRCSHCQSPIHIMLLKNRHRFSALETDLSQCYDCGANLADNPTIRADEKVVQNTQWYEEILEQGYVLLKNQPWIYSFTFFSVLRHLMRCLILDTNKERHIAEAELLPINERYEILYQLRHVFDDWPYDFINFCDERNIQYYELEKIKKANNAIPFWFYKVIREHLYQPNLPPTEESVLTAINVMKKRHLKISLLQLNYFMGFNDSSVIKKVFKSYFELNNSNHKKY